MSALWQTPDFTFTDAYSLGFSLYEVLMASWGTASTDQFPVLNAPGIPNNIAGIAIGPRSTVDRAFITWNPQKPIPQVGLIGGIQNRMRRVSLDSPLLFPQNAQPGTAANQTVAARAGNLYIYPEATPVGGIQYSPSEGVDSTLLPASYTDALGVTQTLGNITAPLNQRFNPPFLHLYLFIQSPIVVPYTKRTPLQVRNQISAITAAGGEQCVAQIPTFGRGCINVTMSSTTGGSYRVGALRALNASINVQEATIGERTTIAANDTVAFQFGGANADYLCLYWTPAADGQVDYTVTAYD